MVKARDLLSKGYFPRELPPAFSTQAFANAVAGRKNVKTQFLGKGSQAELCVHNLVRSGGVRRELGIPNPRTYAHLCQFVSQNWTDLSTLTKRSSLSLTRPVLTKPERAVSPEHSLNERTLRRIELRSTSRFVVLTDISRFYHSVYTHSIPWAVHTKAAVKQAMAGGVLKSLWANDLDTLLRNMNSKQTIGLPVGPDCSLIVAEVLLSAIDEQLQASFATLNGIRFIDDYEFGVASRSEGEQIVSQLQAILSHYGLALNPAKTSIVELPAVFEPLWASRLRTFHFRDAGPVGQRNDLTAYFDVAFDFVRKYQDEGVLKYAVPRLNGVDVEEENWAVFEAILCQCAITEPATLPYICDQLEHYSVLGFTVNSDHWNQIANRVIVERLSLGQASEAVWAMWLMRRFGLSLSPRASKVVSNCEDSPAALMGLGLASVGLGDPDALSQLNRFAEPEELVGRNWMLCYEGVHRGWLQVPSGRDAFQNADDFRFLSAKGVSFFDIDAEPHAPRRRGAVNAGRSDTSAGYDWELYDLWSSV